MGSAVLHSCRYHSHCLQIGMQARLLEVLQLKGPYPARVAGGVTCGMSDVLIWCRSVQGLSPAITDWRPMMALHSASVTLELYCALMSGLLVAANVALPYACKAVVCACCIVRTGWSTTSGSLLHCDITAACCCSLQAVLANSVTKRPADHMHSNGTRPACLNAVQALKLSLRNWFMGLQRT
jgi:hypothetical protein